MTDVTKQDSLSSKALLNILWQGKRSHKWVPLNIQKELFFRIPKKSYIEEIRFWSNESIFNEGFISNCENPWRDTDARNSWRKRGEDSHNLASISGEKLSDFGANEGFFVIEGFSVIEQMRNSLLSRILCHHASYPT